MNKQMNRHGRTPTFADFSRLAGAANAEEDNTHEAFFSKWQMGSIFVSAHCVCFALLTPPNDFHTFILTRISKPYQIRVRQSGRLNFDFKLTFNSSFLKIKDFMSGGVQFNSTPCLKVVCIEKISRTTQQKTTCIISQ